MNKIEMIISTFHQVSGDTTPRVLWSTTLPTISFNTPYQDQLIEEKSELEKSLEAFLESG